MLSKSLFQKINIQYLVVFNLLQIIQAYNILFLVPFPGPSHYIFIGNFIKELLARGHDVTSITNFKLSENSTKYKEILIDPQYDLSGHGNVEKLSHRITFLIIFFFKALQPKNQFQLVYDFDYITTLYDMGLKSGLHGLKDKKVQELIHRNDVHFDLIISEQFFQESWLMFSQKYKAPIITIGKENQSVCLTR